MHAEDDQQYSGVFAHMAMMWMQCRGGYHRRSVARVCTACSAMKQPVNVADGDLSAGGAQLRNATCCRHFAFLVCHFVSDV